MPARLAAVLAAVALPTLTAACSGGGRSASPATAVTTSRPTLTTSPPTTPVPTTPVPTTPVPTTPATSPTTTYTPSAPQATPDAAAAALIDAWATGNRAEADSVAAPVAVGALFRAPYPGEIQARGCTDASTDPGTCTYADLSAGILYEVGVTHLPNGWYVSTVTVET